MDNKTLSAYQKNAAAFADEYDGFEPKRLYQIAEMFFTKHGPTLDVGCGSGRDLRHLLNLGFQDLSGCDASDAMLIEAKKRSASSLISYYTDSLPSLAETNELNKGKQFDNVLCSAALMHLPESEIVDAAISLLRILKDHGVLVLSFRSSLNVQEARESDGRLFSKISIEQLALLFDSLGGHVIFKESSEAQESGKKWHTLVIRKERPADRGLKLAQSIIVDDKKEATYKLGLMLSILDVSQNYSKSAVWLDQELDQSAGDQSARPSMRSEKDMVYVPLRFVAIRWIQLYWCMIEQGVANRNGVMAFEQELRDLIKLAPEGPFVLVQNLDSRKKEVRDAWDKTLKVVCDVIRENPAKYAGSSSGAFFQVFTKKKTAKEIGVPSSAEQRYGYIGMPSSLWRDLCLFSTWIEPRIIFEWHSLLKKFNESRDESELFQCLLRPLTPDHRTTIEMRDFYQDGECICIWSHEVLFGDFEIDHVLPFSLLRNNDLWNLCPASPAVNGQKSDKIPSLEAFQSSKNRIIGCWLQYSHKWPERFWRETARALHPGANGADGVDQSMELAWSGFIELAERLAVTRGAPRWDLPIQASEKSFSKVASRTKPYRPKGK